MAAISGSAPIYKGKLSDNDMRYTVIEQSVDCRKREEKDPANMKPEEFNHEVKEGPEDTSCCKDNKNFYIQKSRYSSTSHYISNH